MIGSHPSAKLDRFLFSLEWEGKFPRTSSRALTRILSDHIPILLDTGNLYLAPPFSDLKICLMTVLTVMCDISEIL